LTGYAGGLERKTKELIALAVSLVNRCEYCCLAHETMALMSGATEQEINETKAVIELFASFNSIADSLRIPCDVTPMMANKNR
jgi:AhpD family alkylhydroperoxidase